MTALTLLIDVLAGLLDGHEREAVLGDLAESRASKADTVMQLVGLVARRYAFDWIRPGPWLALIVAAIPIGIVLSFVSRWWAEVFSMHLTTYVTVWFPGYFESPGARRDLLDWLWRSLAQTGALAGWSWALGFTIARLSRRSAWPVAAVFLLLLFGGTSGTTTTITRHGTSDSVINGSMLAVLVRLLFIAVPMFVGILKGRAHALPSRRYGVASAAVIVGLTVLTLASIEYALTFGRGVIPLPGTDGVVGTADDVRTFAPWISVLMLWPTGYLAHASVMRAWDRSTPSLPRRKGTDT